MKNFNLTQMLQGCSKRNGTTFRQSNPDGQPTVNRQSRLMSRQGYLRNLAMIFAVLVLSMANIGMAWGTSGVITAASTTDLGSGNTPRYVVEQAGVGRLMKNSTGSSAWTVDGGKLQTGSKKFALQTYNAISSIVITGYGTGRDRTFSSMRVGTTTGNYAAASATGSGTMSSTESSQTITITPSSTIAANSYVEITLSGNIYIYSVELVYAGASTKRIYMKCGSTWCNDNPKFYAHSWGSSENDVQLTLAPCETDVYYADIPSGNTSVIFTRQSQSSTGLVWSGSNFWNQSEDITIGANNKFTCTGWSNGKGTFSGGTYSAPTYTISFNGNGSTSGSTSSHTGIACDGSQTLRANGFTRTGWTFTGWNTDKYGKGTAYAAGATVSAITSNITLYAQWEKEIYLKMGSGWADANAWFAIYYYDSGADSNNGWVKMNLAESCSDPAVYKATVPGNGYNTIIFVRKNPADMTLPSWSNKWNQTTNQSLPTSNNQFTITGGSGDSYTGSWGTYSAPTYTISYAANSGSGSMSSQTGIACGTDKATTANAFTRDGYSFTGWHADVDVTVGGANKTAGTLLADKVTIQDISSNITLTAQWEEAATCSGDPTALVSGTLYQVSDMASACLGEITSTGQYFYGLSSNGKFYVNGTTNSNNASTGTVEIKTASNTIDKIEFTGIAWFKDAGTNTCRSIKFVVPSAGTLTIYGKTSSSGGNVVIKTESSGNTTVIAKSVNAYASGSTTVSAGTYYVLSDGASAAIVGLKFVEESCSATQPGTISKGTLSACTLRLTAGDSPASNNTWYWQSSADGTDKTESGATKDVTSTGTYYIRSYCTTGSGCWSDARSVTVSASDLTPAAPTGLTAASTTAKGTTFTVADAANTNNYDFYVSTSSTAPVAGTGATYTETSKTLTITDKVAGTTYYAWVRAVCGSNKSAWTALTGSTFTTSTVTMTPTLTNVTHSGATSGIGGSDYTAVFTADDEYSMPDPTVTIDGNAATSGTDYTWSVEGRVGTITIPANKINGNIAITLNSVPSAPSSATISGAYHYFPGENISLTVTPSGNNGPTTYQWYKGGKADGNRIDGATSATYTKNSCAFADAGSYYCKVTCNATSIWANTNSYENYDVKILRLYVNGSKSGEPYGNVDFTKVDGTTATASIALGSGWTYGFNIADGCGHYYGNSGTMTENNCTNWTTNVNGTDCGLTTTNAATYIFTINYSSLEAIVTSVTYPVGNQAADKVIYFDNSGRNWSGSSIYYRIGHSSHSQASQLSLVSGTANLYKMTTTEYNGFSGWHIANATGDVGSGKSIYKTVDGTPITEATAHEGGAVTQEAITVTPTTSKGYGADVGVNDNCEFFNYTITTGMKTDNVAISPYSNGTITVNYTNTSNEASTLTSGSADLAHSVILTSITAVADEGYDASAITINGGAYNENYVVTGNTTIAASFTLKTYTISYNKGTNGTGSKASETKTHGVNFTLPGSTFTYGGHAQDGWSTSDGGALAYALSGSYTTNAAQEFFPHWKCNTPTITDNGDNTVSITVPSGTTVRYTTDGTNPSSSTGTVYSTTFSIAADCTVKAIAYQSNCTDSEIASQACDYTVPANFQMIATTSGSDATLTHNESISASSKNCATLTGGSAKYLDEDANAKQTMTVKSGESYGWNFNRNKDQIVITLSGHVLQEGSVITVSGYANADKAGFKMNGVTIFSKTSGSGSFADQSYTVLSTDEALINKNVLTLTRNSGSGAYLHSITISNCASGTPCVTPVLPSLTTPNQACTTGEFAAWNATVSNAAAISAAAGSQAVSYSWKNSSSVEVATTASYTPSAAGTYTVTATVHSDASGYIDATATSSTLTASLYTATSIGTQPTTAVAAEEGENFTLGTGMVATGQGDLSYQWYSYTSSGSAGEASIGSATSATYTTSKAAAGTYYYKVKVTADCGTVASNMITVTVTEAPCFKASDLKKAASGWSDLTSGATLNASTVVGTITGGTITNSGTDAIGANNSDGNGLVIEGSKEITVTLSGSHVLGSSSVITLTCAGNNTTSSHTSGFAISGLAMDPATEGPSTTSCNTFTQTFEVSGTVLEGSKSFKIALADGTSKTYLRSITVTGCADCTPITPSLTYSKSTFWMDDATLTATATLTGYYGTPTITYTSSDPTVVRVDNASTGAITALKRGTATITATIGATTYSETDYCGNTATCNITVKDMTCGYTEIASAVLTSKTAATTVNATLLVNGLADISSGSCKLNGKGAYFGLQLPSGSFQVGDSIEFKIKKNDGTEAYIFATTDTTGLQTTDAIYTATSLTSGDNIIKFIVTSGTMLTKLNTTKKIAIVRRTKNGVLNQNHSVYYVKVKRYGCPDIFIYDDAAGTHEWSDDDNWIGAAGHGSGLPTSEDRVFINESVTVDVATAAAAELHITNGSMVTVEKSITVGDVNIETGSTLNVAKDGESGITVATNSLYLKGGWNNSYTSYDMPRIYIDPASTLTKVVNTVNLDISVDSRNYYPIAVPFRVKVSDVDYANSTLASFSNYGANGQYVIKDYDGERRAENGPDQVNNWKVVPQKDEKNNDVYLEPGRGYIMTAISIPSYGGGVIRFPMSFTNDWTAEGEQGTVDAVTKNVVAVKAYEGAATAGDKKVNKGWNLLGVPFMSCYGTGADMGTDGVVMQGKFDFKTGDWKEEAVRYVNVPVHDFSEYIQVDMEDDDPVTVLRPGWCFFVQVEEDGDLTFLTADQAASSSLPIYAPKRGVKADMPTVKTGIILSDGEKSDKTTFLVSDKYNGAEYEINADMEKMFGNGYTLATYSLSGTTRLAYNALGNADAANIIPIGYRAPADGEYTFSINPRYAENGAFESVNLIDYETGIVTDLLKFSYTFSTVRTQNDTRFALNVVKQKETPTDIELVGGDAQVDGPRKLLLDGKMYIILDGKMFDAQGKRVQ